MVHDGDDRLVATALQLLSAVCQRTVAVSHCLQVEVEEDHADCEVEHRDDPGGRQQQVHHTVHQLIVAEREPDGDELVQGQQQVGRLERHGRAVAAEHDPGAGRGRLRGQHHVHQPDGRQRQAQTEVGGGQVGDEQHHRLLPEGGSAHHHRQRTDEREHQQHADGHFDQVQHGGDWRRPEPLGD